MLPTLLFSIFLPLINKPVAPDVSQLHPIYTHLPESTSITQMANGSLLVSVKDGSVISLGANNTYTTILDMHNQVNTNTDRGITAARVRPGTDDLFMLYAAETSSPDSSQDTNLVAAKYNLTSHVLTQISQNANDVNFQSHSTADIVFYQGAPYASFGDGRDSSDKNQGYDSVYGGGFNGKIVNLDTLQTYAIGFRNPWRMTVFADTIYATDVGDEAWEEIDKVQQNANYGWPCLEGPTQTDVWNRCVTDARGPFKAPFIVYDHSVGEAATAIVSYKGELLFADYVRTWVRDAHMNIRFTGSGGIVDMQVLNGCLYAVTIEFDNSSNVLTTCSS